MPYYTSTTSMCFHSQKPSSVVFLWRGFAWLWNVVYNEEGSFKHQSMLSTFVIILFKEPFPFEWWIRGHGRGDIDALHFRHELPKGRICM